MAIRTFAFCDGQYLSTVISKIVQTQISIDFGLLINHLLRPDEELIRTYYYDALPYLSQTPTPEDTERVTRKNNFFRKLEALEGFEVHQGRTESRGTDAAGKGIFIQKQVDVLLAVDILLSTFRQAADRIILVAGDSDYIPVVREAKAAGAIVRLIHGPDHTFHKELWQACDWRRELTLQDINTASRK